VIDVITLAFVTDPIARWASPTAHGYLATMPDFIDAFGCCGLPHGTTYVVEGFAGAALWLAPGVEPDAARMAALMSAPSDAAPAVQAELAAVFEQMGSYHPAEPHWYLPIIGVDPAQQGRGYGAALMRHAVQRFDRDGATAYLESSNARNIPLYQRHGFEILGTVQVGSSPEVVPMLRRPR
jgi:ribosomal protein S18 acetylase RimI-like enzyme